MSFCENERKKQKRNNKNGNKNERRTSNANQKQQVPEPETVGMVSNQGLRGRVFFPIQSVSNSTTDFGLISGIEEAEI